MMIEALIVLEIGKGKWGAQMEKKYFFMNKLEVKIAKRTMVWLECIFPSILL